MKTNIDFLTEIQENFVNYASRPAFCISNQFFTYSQLSHCVSKVGERLKPVSDEYIGLVANDELMTYASILAIWLEGKCYVPLHPHQPLARNKDIIHQVGINTLLDSSPCSSFTDCGVQIIAETVGSEATDACLQADHIFDASHHAYILFTSGSTGRPKGVPVTFGNVSAFLDSIREMGLELSSEDRCLQMFDLTFDLSVGSYLPSLVAGACAYTVAPGCVKWQEVGRLIEDYHLTEALMVPSVIHYLRPYMDELEADALRYSLFCGEALLADDVKAWEARIPRAKIWNVYGPTENTIYCTAYEIGDTICEKNGIVSIGTDMKHSATMIVDDNRQPVAIGETGELCLSGQQLTPGYWRDEVKNTSSFFVSDGIRWYLTGDVCYRQSDGNIIYLGRKDSQVKIQGYRVELSEIENVARHFYHDEVAVVATTFGDESALRIAIAVEAEDNQCGFQLVDYLKEYLPAYMIPEKVVYLKAFPQNSNNKTDRKAIKELIK